ncbi:hypothetical protein YK56LOC_38260 [Caballeronia sp. HLA56]
MLGKQGAALCVHFRNRRVPTTCILKFQDRSSDRGISLLNLINTANECAGLIRCIGSRNQPLEFRQMCLNVGMGRDDIRLLQCKIRRGGDQHNIARGDGASIDRRA